MSQIQLEQGSEDWVKYRLTKVTASEMASIMGKSPYKTALQVYHQKKTGESEPQNAAMAKGIYLEPIARRIYENQVNADFPPACFTSDEHPFLMASLDGFNADMNEIIEIKTQSQKNHLLDTVVPHYMIQIQTQLLVSKATKATLVSYNPDVIDDPLRTIDVLPDPKMQSEILEAAKSFWQNFKDNLSPEPEERDLMEVSPDSVVGQKLTEYRLATVQLKHWEETVDRMKKDVTDILEAEAIHAAKFMDLTIKKATRKGAIDFSNLPEIKNVDLELYRKASYSFWTIHTKRKAQNG